MSTAPVKKKRVLVDKDPLIVTPAAAARLQELLQSAEGDPVGVLLGVKKRGCNGLSYTLNYAHETPDDKHAALSAHGVNVFIEPMAFFHVVGTEMDWEETELSSEFTFSNPNSKGECGCGESFNV